MFVKFFKNGKTFFLRRDIYDLREVNEFGDPDDMGHIIINEIADKAYRFLKDRGFKVYKIVGKEYSNIKVVIRNKADESQLHLINAGIINIAPTPRPAPTPKQKQPIFNL